MGNLNPSHYAGWLSGAHPGVLAYWSFLQILVIFAAIAILISSSEDLLIDVFYWLGAFFRPFFGRRHPPMRKLVAKEEKTIAMMIPAWQESAVIAPMLINALSRFEYEAYHIFVGVYPNDPETGVEIDAMAARFRNIHRVDLARPGPTTKADCLNQVVHSALALERELDLHFDIFANFDAEDVVDGLELKVMNWFIEDAGMVQLPVLSMDRDPYAFVACHYMDEFAEWHGKDLVVRSFLSGMIPSAGVATGIGRKAVDGLLAARNGDLFNVQSLTEDYELGFELARLGFRSRFVRYWARVRSNRSRFFPLYRRRLVATREYFPDTVRTSVRQKARWMLGICVFGWQHLGWWGGPVTRYFLWRDRKALFTAPVAIIGYLLVIQWLAYAGLLWMVPGFPALPPLVDRPWVWTIIEINLLLMINRLVHRAIFVTRANGIRYAPLSPLRAVVANWISFRALCRSVGQLALSAATGRPIGWTKTDHTFPDADLLIRRDGKKQKPGGGQ